ncbi:putative esterase [Diplonema papillatum]|nr:putative esterase [Diplonema papillatum]|eukprot:gene20129-30936_t
MLKLSLLCAVFGALALQCACYRADPPAASPEGAPSGEREGMQTSALALRRRRPVLFWGAAAAAAGAALLLGLLDYNRKRDSKVAKRWAGDAAAEKLRSFAAALRGVEYVPTWYLPTGLLQTSISETGKLEGPVAYSERLVALASVDFGPEGSPYLCCPRTIPHGRIALHWAVTDNQGPIVVVSPGLTGDSSAGYIRVFVDALLRAPEAYRPVVYHPRGLGNVDVLTPFMYSCGYTHDYRRVVAQIAEEETQRTGAKPTMFAVGFSLGANYVAKYLGEEGDRTPIAAACCLAGPVDCKAAMQNLTAGVVGRHLLDPYLTGNLQKTFAKVERLFLEPRHATVDVLALRNVKTLWSFDNTITAPLMGCSDADDYYDQAACMHVLSGIAVPTAFLHAVNDPIVPASSVPAKYFHENPNIASFVTHHGGHSMIWPVHWGLDSWSAKFVVRFFGTPAS